MKKQGLVQEELLALAIHWCRPVGLEPQLQLHLDPGPFLANQMCVEFSLQTFLRKNVALGL